MCDGTDLILNVVGAGGSLKYQWQLDGKDISGATLATYTATAATSANAGSYAVTITNSCGSVKSGVATVTVSTKPVITTQPVATINVSEGSAINLSVVASGAALKYQWKLNGNAIAGATSSTYSKSSATKSDEGTYVCEVTNDCGNVTSSTSTVAVGTSSITDAENFGYSLGSPEPNPMGEVATIRVRVPHAGTVRVDVSDVAGRVVATVIDGTIEAGEHTQILSAANSNLGSGVYTLRLVTSEGYVSTKRMVIIR